jgi:Na+/H+ antiporter NhaC
MSFPTPRPSRWLVWVFVAAVSIVLVIGGWDLGKLWPPLAAVAVILATRNALAGLLTGGFVGAILLTGGHPAHAAVSVLTDHLWPGLQSPWKFGAIIFTLVLGGFASILEAGGGFTRLMHKAIGSSTDTNRRLESAAAGLGLLCFFDGLANSMVVGRVSRDLADRHRVARTKLAYIVDSTSSAVACLAFVSTWIAFQLSMIGDAFALAGRTVNPYAAFLQSLPYNFYCWFTLVMLFVAIRGRFHPGPMGKFVAEVESQPPAETAATATGTHGSVATSLVPLAALMAAFFVGFVALGSPRPIWPLDRDKIVAAFGSDAGPMVLVAASALATLVALVMFPAQANGKWKTAGAAFLRGVKTMVAPIFILLAAWILGSVISELGTATLISRLATGSNSLALLPMLTFLTGAVISFSTGTSWGTMGILFPLSIPAAAALGASDGFLTIIVAAVFSGAVFGDHCSPFSDTTIVSSISCGVTPHDHVRTQIPYAMITALVAIAVGFLPAGYGVPGWILLLAGSGSLLLIGRFAKTPG